MKAGAFLAKRSVLWTLLLLALCGASPQVAQAEAGASVTFSDAAGLDRIYHFAIGNNDHLVVNYWDGYAWHWADQGLPSGVNGVYDPVAITFKDFVGTQWIYVFAVGHATGVPHGPLVVHYWDGSQWHWANQGGDLAKKPVVITYVDSSSHRRIYVFGERHSDSHLVVNYWNGFVWQWADQGLPAGASSVSPLDAVTYSDGGQRIYVFAKAMGPAFPSYPGPKLVVNYWDSSAWHWLNMGGAGGGDVTRASAITYFDGCEGRGCEGRQRVYLFSTSSDYKSLWTTYWDGYGWHSADLGAPPGHTGINGPVSAVTFLDNAGQRRIYVFVSNHVLGASTDLVAKLYLKYWNGSAWNWADRGAPAIPSGVHSNYRLDATSYADSNGYRWVHVFGSLVLAGENPGQYEDHWVRNFSVLGAFASWAYQGTLP